MIANSIFSCVFLITLSACTVWCSESDEFFCCTPPKWTGRVRADTASVIEGVNTFKETWMTLHYDSENQRQAWTDVLEDNKPLGYQRTILDYKNHSWTIVVDDKLCVIYNLTGDFEPKCTPKNITFVLFALAPILSPLQGAFVNTVSYNRPNVTGHVAVTVGQCAFVEEVMFDYSMKDHAIVDNIQYFNQTVTVDEEVFTIPHNCIHAPPDDLGDHHMQLSNRVRRYFDIRP